MRYGIELAPWGDYADPRALAALAGEAEAGGWDGLFLWDAMVHDEQGLPKADPWIALAAVALSTERIRFGPMVTPLPRRRPWRVAREAVTLDWLSGGRLVLGVGLGDPSEEEFAWFGEPGSDHRIRARMLDEGLAILDGLWTGEPFAFAGEFYDVHEMTFLPRPLQSPRIPVWTGGWWPNRAPLRRAVRWDGFHPGRLDGPLSVDDVTAITAEAKQARAGAPFDIVVADRPGQLAAGELPGRVRALEQAGATWWLAKAGALPARVMEAIVRQGPPR